MAGPGVPAGVRAPGVARTADVTPTLLRLLGMDPLAADLDGVDLLAPGRPARAMPRPYYPRSLGWAPLHSYRVGALKSSTRRGRSSTTLPPIPASSATSRAPIPAQVARLREALGAGAAGRDERRAQRVGPARSRSGCAPSATWPTAPAPASAENALADPKDRIERWQLFEEGTWAEATGRPRRRGDRVPALVRGRAGERHLPPIARRRACGRAGTRGRRRTRWATLESLAPDDPLAWHEAAVSRAEAGRLEEAIRAERRAIALGPDLPELHNHLGILLARGGEVPAALGPS